MASFNHSVAVITGAASGIGKSLAQRLAQQGIALALIDKDIQGLEQLQSKLTEYSVLTTIHKLDVSDAKAFIELAIKVSQQHGRIDLLFNNAGVSLIDSVENQSIEDFQWVMNINFWGVVNGTHAFLPHLKKSPNAHIVNVSSLFGLLSAPLQSAYNASKHAVKGFTESLKMEMAGSNVHVHCVHPGGIKTNITNSAKISTNSISRNQVIDDFNKLAKTSADDAAEAILAGLKSNKRRILIGKDAWLLDKIARWFPNSYEKILGFEKGVIALRKQREKSKG